MKKMKDHNLKPALIFDKTYGTSLHTEYSFPGGLTADEAHIILVPGIFWRKSSKHRQTLARNLISSLNEDHFPVKMSGLDEDQKFHILQGMAAGFPPRDIIYFSIEGVVAYMNTEVNREMDRHGLKYQWVVSPDTWKVIKQQLKL